MIPASLSSVARRFSFVREVGVNDGTWVTFFQRITGNTPGQSWCASFVFMVCDIAYGGKSPLPKTAWCPTMLIASRAKGWIVQEPQVDDVFFYVKNSEAHHVGIVTGVTPLTGIAGNTSEDGMSADGTGVFEHAISAAAVFVRLPKE